MRTFLLPLFTTATLAALLLFGPPASMAQTAMDLPRALNAAANVVQAGLDGIDFDLRDAVRAVREHPLDGAAARRALAAFYREQPGAVDAATIDKSGILRAVHPPRHKQAEGKDISGQAQFKRLVATGKPVLSEVFEAVEGMAALDAEFPVYSLDMKLRGSVSLLFDREWLAVKLDPVAAGTGYEILVLQPDGVLLYHSASKEFGESVPASSDPQAQGGLGRVVAAMRRDETGKQDYAVRDAGNNLLRKRMGWATVSLYGTPWRVAVAFVVPPAEE